MPLGVTLHLIVSFPVRHCAQFFKRLAEQGATGVCTDLDFTNATFGEEMVEESPGVEMEDEEVPELVHEERHNGLVPEEDN